MAYANQPYNFMPAQPQYRYDNVAMYGFDTTKELWERLKKGGGGNVG